MENIVGRFQLQFWDGREDKLHDIGGLLIGEDIKDMMTALVENYEYEFCSYEIQKIEFTEVKDENYKAVIIENIDNDYPETYCIK